MAPRRGTPVTLRQAATRYGLNPATLSRWARRGLVTVIAASQGRGHPITLDEHSVASIAQRYLRNPGKGKATAVDADQLQSAISDNKPKTRGVK